MGSLLDGARRSLGRSPRHAGLARHGRDASYGHQLGTRRARSCLNRVARSSRAGILVDFAERLPRVPAACRRSFLL